MIQVVCGFIERDGRVLLTQRTPTRDFPYTWETPGGKVEGDHESNHSALRRELKEEIDIQVGRLDELSIWCGEIELPKVTVFLSCYHVHTYSGAPRPMEGQGLGWFTVEEMARLPLIVGNQKLFPTLAKALWTVQAARRGCTCTLNSCQVHSK